MKVCCSRVQKTSGGNNKQENTRATAFIDEPWEANITGASPVTAAEVFEPAASILMGPCGSKNLTLWKLILSSQSPRPSWPSPFPPQANTLPWAATKTHKLNETTSHLRLKGTRRRIRTWPEHTNVWFRPHATRSTFSAFRAGRQNALWGKYSAIGL